MYFLGVPLGISPGFVLGICTGMSFGIATVISLWSYFRNPCKDSSKNSAPLIFFQGFLGGFLQAFHPESSQCFLQRFQYEFLNDSSSRDASFFWISHFFTSFSRVFFRIFFSGFQKKTYGIPIGFRPVVLRVISPQIHLGICPEISQGILLKISSVILLEAIWKFLQGFFHRDYFNDFLKNYSINFARDSFRN